MKKHTLLLLIIFLLVGIIIILLGLFIKKNNIQLVQNDISTPKINTPIQEEVSVTQEETNQIDIWETYSNQQLGIEFQYPNEWPEPALTDGSFTGGFPLENPILWLHIGIISKGPCEGADCSQFRLESYDYLDYNNALVALQENELITSIEEKIINGNKVILFIESGLRADQTALFFTPDKTLKLINIWGDKKEFDEIINSLNIIELTDSEVTIDEEEKVPPDSVERDLNSIIKPGSYVANLPNLICKNSLSEEIEKSKEYGYYGEINLNGCTYDEDSLELLFDDNNINCQASVNQEITNKKYNIINGCIYQEEDRLFEYNLLVYTELERPENYRGLGEVAYEWFRFTENDYLFIYLAGGAGCGGCSFNGPYLEINQNTGGTQFKFPELPYRPNVYLSPDNKKGVYPFYSQEKKSESLVLFDFIKNEIVKELYEFKPEETIFFTGHGSYAIDDAVNWLDDKTIEMQPYKKSTTGGAEGTCNKDGCTYIELGSPITIRI